MMIQRFIAALSGSPEAQASDFDALALAAAAVLVEAARADDHYTDEEKRLIEDTLRGEFAHTAEDAVRVREMAEARRADAADLHQFTRPLKTLSPYMKDAFVEALWRVVLSDAKRDPWEEMVIRRVCGLIYVSDVDSGKARARAEAALKAR